MARETKTGLNYYNIDTDIFMNRDIKRLIKNFSGKGFTIYTFILTEIYRDKGCYLLWDKDTAFDVSDVLHFSESLVEEVKNYCISTGLFNKELYESESILTSKNIQERWFKICKTAKRSNYNLPIEYNLILSIPEIKKFFQEYYGKTPEVKVKTQEEIPQSKVKESKEKKEGIYTPEKFLQTWGVARMHYDKKPTHINSLNPNEKSDFMNLIKIYGKQEFEEAMNGLFFQKTFPAVRVRPTWLLKIENFENMRDCWLNNNKMFNEKKEQKI